MKLLADMHIAPRTVELLQSLGHDVIRVPDALPASASDSEIVAHAIRDGRTILTQDLDFTDLVALSGQQGPSVMTLRLASSHVDHVNSILAKVLPDLEEAVREGAMVTVQDATIRRRLLPITRE